MARQPTREHEDWARDRGGLAPACHSVAVASRMRVGVGRGVSPRWVQGRRAGVLLGLVGAVVLGCAPAGAWGLAQRGHVPTFSFGSAGAGAGQFRFEGTFKLTEGAGVAVSEASGDVYVVDRGNDRVEQFAPVFGGSGELVGERFLAAWGWGVSDGKDEYEVCTSSCQAGIAGSEPGQLKEAGPIAVDNTVGGAETVYVGANAADKHPDVQRFSADGEQALGRLADSKEGRLDGIATDLHGRVWLYRGEEEEAGTIEAFTDTLKPKRLEPSVSSPLECAKPGFGVDGAGEDFYVAHELLSAEGECPAVLEREAAEEGTLLDGALARPVVVAKLHGEEAVVGELERESATGVAVDQASGADTPLGEAANGDVYVDEGSAVAVFDAQGTLVDRLGAGVLEQGTGVAVDSKTGDVFVIDAGKDRVDVFAPEPTGRPVVEDLEVQDLSPSEARVSAHVNPEGADTHYYFQYGTGDCVSDPSGCTALPQAPGTDLGSGFGAQSVSATITGLEPGTSYHYRLVASSGQFGEAEASQTLESFQTLPSPEGLLTDGREWELVSPAEKDGASIEALPREGGVVQAAANGGAVAYVASGPVVAEPAGNRSPEATQVISSRGGEGWVSEDAVTPHEKGEGLEGGKPAEFRVFSEDLSLGLAQPTGGSTEPLEAPPLAPGASEKTLYLRDQPTVAPSSAEQQAYGEARANSGFLAPGFLALVSPLDVTASGSRFGGRLEFLDATPDLSHVVFASEVPLLEGSSAGLYEWRAGGGLQLVSVLPSSEGHAGVPASEPALGDENVNVRDAISDDGSRVFFTAEGEQEGAPTGLYLHDSSNGETLRVNAAQGVVEPTGEEAEVAFQAATPDGSRVFFTDTAPLTPESGQRQERTADLYECEVVEHEGKLACKLKDLTPLPGGGSADVLNLIAGVSEDGSSVYFVANGVLAAGAQPGDCVHQSQETAAAGAACNLYVWHEGAISLVAVLSDEDSGDWGSLYGPGRVGGFIENRPDLADLTASVSPDGHYLAFMSQMPLVGYETSDADHAGEGVRDEEVYLYDAASGLLTCVSCDPSGAPVGVHDTEHSGEGQGLVVDRRGDWAGEYLAGSIPGWDPLGVDWAVHQPRYLTDSGRLFFDSPDQLVAQASNGKEDVYEYEPENVGSCTQPQGCVSLISAGSSEHESAFLEASETGNDAFFITAQPLVPADHDSNYDLYDARVCTSESPCLTSQASSAGSCESAQACRPGSAPAPTFATPPSATVAGPGNTPHTQALGFSHSTPKPKPPTRAQLLTRLLKQCRKLKGRHKKRVACEKLAYKRYGAHKAKKSAKPASKDQGR